MHKWLCTCVTIYVPVHLFKVSISFQANTGSATITEDGQVAKRLFMTPTPSQMQGNEPAIYQQVIGSRIMELSTQEKPPSTIGKGKAKINMGRLPKVCVPLP